MIGYCPLDEDPIERPRPSREVSVSVPVQEKRKNSSQSRKKRFAIDFRVFIFRGQGIPLDAKWCSPVTRISCVSIQAIIIART